MIKKTIKTYNNKSRKGTYISLKGDNVPARVYKVPDTTPETIQTITDLYTNAYITPTSMNSKTQHNIGKSAKRLLSARNLHNLLIKGTITQKNEFNTTNKKSLHDYRKNLIEQITRDKNDQNRIKQQLHKLSGNMNTQINLLDENKRIIGEIKIPATNITKLIRLLSQLRLIDYILSSQNVIRLREHIRRSIPSATVTKLSAGDAKIKTFQMETRYSK